MASTPSGNVGSTIEDLISSYSILTSLAPWLSTLDLFNLSLTRKSAYEYIRSSPTIFKSLSRHCLCDGRGLATRQAYASPYHRNRMAGQSTLSPHLKGDEEIEVRLYNTRCDEAGGFAYDAKRRSARWRGSTLRNEQKWSGIGFFGVLAARRSRTEPYRVVSGAEDGICQKVNGIRNVRTLARNILSLITSEQDPDYPRWVSDDNNKYPTPYPRLGYLRSGEDEETMVS
ncbi:hypothetical protein LZL87_008897 [Fusarium oxysporum]|nr:hypothetical protein LZL87_008897 [Fusarium oxysporum]